MTGFSDLPSELIIHVWYYVLDPEAVENFALTSKTIYALGGPFIAEHNELNAQFSTISHREREMDHSPAETLKSILLNPRAALYVRELHVAGWRTAWSDWDEPQYHTPYSEDTVELFRQSIIESPHILESEVEHWLDVLEAGNEVVIHSLMVAKLLNVRAIGIDGGTQPREMQNLFFGTVEAIAKSRDTEALSRLVKVRVGPAVNAFESVRIFTTLPSLKAIEAWNIFLGCNCPNHKGVGGCSSDCHRDKYVCDDAVHHDRSGRMKLLPRSSAVAHLAFMDCNLDTKKICRYLEGPRALESFEYLGTSPGHERNESRAIVDALLAHAKSTLRKLRLRPGKYVSACVGTLVGFEVMKELEIDYGYLSENKVSGRCRLVDLLPPSIEKAHVSAIEMAEYNAVRKNVRDIIRNKAKRLPNLKELTIELRLTDHGAVKMGVRYVFSDKAKHLELRQIDEGFIAEMNSMKQKCEAVGLVFNVITETLEIKNSFKSPFRRC